MTTTPEFSEYRPAPIVRTTPAAPTEQEIAETPGAEPRIEDTMEYENLRWAVDILLRRADSNPLLMVRALNELASEMTYFCVSVFAEDERLI